MQQLKTQDIKPCSNYGGPVVPIHYRVKIEQVVIDMGSAQEFAGLTQFFHGHSRLAEVMGTGIKGEVMNTWEGLICLKCQEEVARLLLSLGDPCEK